MSRSINSINSDTIYGLIGRFISGYPYLSIEILNTWIWGKTAKRYSLLYSRIEFMRSQTIGFGLRNISHFAKESLRINTTARCTKISLSNQKNIGIQNSVCCPPLIRTLLHGKQRQSEEETNFSFMIDCQCWLFAWIWCRPSWLSFFASQTKKITFASSFSHTLK